MCSRHYNQWRVGTPPDQRVPLSTEERFWLKVDRRGADECWPWLGSKQGGEGREHGTFYSAIDGRKVPAHRVAIILSGRPMPVGAWALHLCDNGTCVNPAHLYWGSVADNNRDTWERTRSPGEGHHQAKLNEAAVLDIRRRRADGEEGRALAAEYGISESQVSNIVHRKAWTHI